MGNDLHITRRKFWADQGNDITAQEWLACVKSDPELRPTPKNGPYFVEWGNGSWLDWSEGVISTRNPNEALMAKMVAIAKRFNATVQGDDGEIYDGSKPSQPPPASLGSRIAGWFSKPRPQPQPKIEPDPLPFGVGDKVIDTFGLEHTILSIDPNANSGLGEIKSRRSNDGSEHSFALIAHGFNPVPKK
jgi:hypothetical protein